MSERVLVTGGAGYVGSHACKALARAGIVPVAYDDLRRGNRWAVRWGPLVEAPLEDRDALVAAMREHDVTSVMHFAAYAYVGESMDAPSLYFRNNVAQSLNLLDAMVEAGIRRLVISSTCAVYGIPSAQPISEETPLGPVNPYGASKVMLEELARWYGACHGIDWVALRYFNAAGADPDGEIGEAHDPEPHLVPLAIEATRPGARPLTIHGTDYPTEDGTAIRDFVHVTDLADAHVLALGHLSANGRCRALNLGTGRGHSVLEVVRTLELVSGQAVPCLDAPRRPGDVPRLVADARVAGMELAWFPRRSDLETILASAWDWHKSLNFGAKAGAVGRTVRTSRAGSSDARKFC